MGNLAFFLAYKALGHPERLETQGAHKRCVCGCVGGCGGREAGVLGGFLLPLTSHLITCRISVSSMLAAAALVLHVCQVKAGTVLKMLSMFNTSGS